MFMFFLVKKNTRKILQINTVLILAFLLAIEFSLGFTADNKANQLRALRTKDATYQPVVLPSETAKRRDLQKIVTDPAGSPLVPIAGIPSGYPLCCVRKEDGWVDYRSDVRIEQPRRCDRGRKFFRLFWSVTLSFTVIAFKPETRSLIKFWTRYPDAKNLGFGGSGPLLQIAIFKESGRGFIEYECFLAVFVNDLADLDLETKNPTLMD